MRRDLTWRSLWSRRFPDPLADAETFRADASGMLVEIGGKTQNIAEIPGQYMGLLKITPAAWLFIERLFVQLDPAVRDRLDMTALLRIVLGRGFPVHTLSTVGHWGEVDRPQ